MKTCWRKLPEFNATAAMLRVKYHRAIRKFPTNKSSRRSLMEFGRNRRMVCTFFNLMIDILCSI